MSQGGRFLFLLYFSARSFVPVDVYDSTFVRKWTASKLRGIVDVERSRNQREGSEFFYGGGLYKMVSCYLPHDGVYCDTFRIRTQPLSYDSHS